MIGSQSARPSRQSGHCEPARPRLLRMEPLEDRRLLTAARAAEAVNLFALDVYEQMQREEGNLFFSPLSIATGLAMAYAGAAGQTAAEMEQVLHFGIEPGIHESFGDLIGSIESHNEVFALPPQLPHVLTVANAIWPDDSIMVEQEFLDVMQAFYDGYVQTVDYDNPQQAEDTINQWVSDSTHGKIPDLVSDLSPIIRLVLTNAVYFNGYWEAPFDPRHTESLPFKLGDGQSIDAPTMYTELAAPYHVFDGFAVLELPFEGGFRNADYSMVLVLPPETGDQELNLELFSQIDGWLDDSPDEQYVLVTLPKIDTAVSTSLNQLLIGLGMPTAFAPGAADFSSMTPEHVFIDKVFHKATLTVNEQGTTAAAATEISFGICFAKGTPVLTPEGSKPIEQLQAGDLVLARDENNLEGELQPKRVEKVHRNQGAILELQVRDRVIRTTAAHPFFAYGKGWTPAGDLRPGDRLATSAFDWAEVDSVKFTRQNEPVYNLRVADHHTYFVGGMQWQFAVWVHNACGGEPEFFVDRPYHLMIRDNITGTVAFMGRIDDPTQLQNSVAPVVVDVNADFDDNQAVDGGDFLAWQRGHGMSSSAQAADGDSDADGDVDATDLTEWMSAYGQQQAAPLTSLAAGDDDSFGDASVYHPVSSASLVDAAMALDWLTTVGNEDESLNVGDPKLLLQDAGADDVYDQPIPVASASTAFESLASTSEDEVFVVDAELDHDPLAPMVE